MKHFLTLIGFFFAILSVNAQTAKTQQFHLWPNGAPNSNEISVPEEDHGPYVEKVTDPMLTVYMPEKPNGLAVLACPGGSYLQVWHIPEGHDMASWFNSQGIVYAVLKYRLPNGHCEVPLSDVHRAMAIMKEHQNEYSFTKLGILGCSAGGHLASTAATHYTGPENRPDFQILFYPVISQNPTFSHALSFQMLLGKNAPRELELKYSNELMVTSDNPPAFITASSDDDLVPVRNSVDYYSALVANKVPASLHLYPTGGHGWFGNANFPYRNAWLNDLSIWLQHQIEK